MAVVVLDASVAIGVLDATDAHHAGAIAALAEHESDELILPASAYAELLVAPWRRGARAAGGVDEFLNELAVRIEPLTREMARHAAHLRAVHSRLSLPDALVLATGDVLDAGVVLTADHGWRRLSRRARVI
jgi:predicted nucleic acid-binding protein